MTKNLGVRRGAVRINPTTPRPFAEFILRVTEGLRVTLSGTFDTKPAQGERLYYYSRLRAIPIDSFQSLLGNFLD